MVPPVVCMEQVTGPKREGLGEPACSGEPGLCANVVSLIVSKHRFGAWET